VQHAGLSASLMQREKGGGLGGRDCEQNVFVFISLSTFLYSSFRSLSSVSRPRCETERETERERERDIYASKGTCTHAHAHA